MPALTPPTEHDATTHPPLSLLQNMGRWAICSLIVLMVAGCVVLFGGAMLDHAFTPDLPWLLAGGQYILENGRLPQHDLFSWTMPNQPWVLYQWLFEVILAGAYSLIDEHTIIRLFTVLCAGLYLIYPVWGRFRHHPLIFSLIIGSLSLIIISINISLRPMIVSALFLAVQYSLIQRYRRQKIGKQWFWGSLVVLYALWGNMHTGVVLGLFSLGLLALGDWLEQRGAYAFQPIIAEEEGRPQPLKVYGILLATGFMASLLNPYGIGIYIHLAQLSGQSGLNSMIQELQSPDFHRAQYQMFLLLLAGFAVLLPQHRRVFSAGEFLHLLVFTICMLFVQRFVVWTVLFYVLILPKALYYAWTDIRLNRPFLEQTVLGMDRLRPVLNILLTTLIGTFLFMPEHFPPPKYGACQPVMEGIDVYQYTLRRKSDILLNDPEVGSCMLYQYPTQKVFIDSRFDFYGQSHVTTHRLAMHTVGYWQDFLDRWRIDTVVMMKNKPLTSVLREHPNYKLLYEDNAMVVLRKQSR